MTLTGGNDNSIVYDFVNQSMLLCNAARPMPCPVMLERLGFASAFEGVTHYFNYKGVYLLVGSLVVFFPLTVFGESIVFKTNHSCLLSSSAAFIASSRVSKEIRFFPSLTFLIVLSSLSRITGLLIRNSVSSCSRISISTTWSGYVVLIVLIKEFSNSIVCGCHTFNIYTQSSERQGGGK